MSTGQLEVIYEPKPVAIRYPFTRDGFLSHLRTEHARCMTLAHEGKDLDEKFNAAAKAAIIKQHLMERGVRV